MFTRRTLISGSAAAASMVIAPSFAQNQLCCIATYSATSIRPLIFFETDMAGDVDDVAALQVVINQQNAGKCTLIGANGNSSNTYTSPCLAAMLSAVGMSSVPIGAYQGTDMPSSSAYTQQVTSRFGISGDTRSNYISGVNNLRAVLSRQPNGSVVIVSTGFLSNLYSLLQSSADQYSSLSGVQLVTAKVSSFVISGGVYTSGSEYNFDANDANGTYSSYVVANIPSTIPIYGVDYNLGNSITWSFPSGNPLTNPFVYAYQLFGGSTHQGWDPAAMMYATGFSSLFNFQGQNGTNTVNSSGANTWTSSAGNYSYLGAVSTSAIATQITAIAQAVT